MNDDFRLQSYEMDLQSAVDLHIGDLITPYSLAALRNHIAAIRSGFLSRNMDYNAFGDVTVKANGNEVICRAPVEHKTDTAARIKAENERAALIAELKQRSIHDERRMANLKRRHSKLLRKHQDNLSYGIKKIWNGLSLQEQYTILKDMDYNLRHND